MENKELFTEIYKNYGFGGDESRSGGGSSLDATKSIREKIVELIKEKNIFSIVDIPCGDFNWMKEIVGEFKSYIGGDIVEKCISSNNDLYGDDAIKFIVHDLLHDPIPDGDLLILRDIIGHYCLDDGKRIMRNIINSKCKYLLSTSFYNINNKEYYKTHVNQDITNGRWYCLNLMSPPFNFPEPELIFEEDAKVDDYDNGMRKILGLWEIEKLRLGNYIDITKISTSDDSWINDIFNQFHSKKGVVIFLEDMVDGDKPVIKNVIEINKGKLEDEQKSIKKEKQNLTVVTGLWDIDRPGRSFDTYIDQFKNVLDIDCNLFIHIQKKYEHIVWENKHRNKDNTFVKIYELEDIKELFGCFWDKVQFIRQNPNWYNQSVWLPGSPQAVLEYYNPIVMSKYSMLHNASVWNPFTTDYFIWLDAGITFTVYEKYFTEQRVLDKIIPHLKTFLFLSYPYDAVNEIHGFTYKDMNRYAGETVKYVCRGGLFGGHKDIIHEGNSTYWHLVNNSLDEGLMGTEESIFAIMAYKEPHIYRRYALDENGLIVKFIDDLDKDKVELVQIPKTLINIPIALYDLDKIKTNVYILTFNFPEQLQFTINSMEKVPEWLTIPHLVLIDNSTTDEPANANKLIAEKYNMEYIRMETNTGICGGRQKAAEHFHESDADYMLFFEDDMTINSVEMEGKFCRNGFRKYIPNLYRIIHKIMMKENFDFLKLSFTEVYFDNDKALPWYNVPQSVRTRDWPDYDKLPTSGLDPNSPPTIYKHVKVCDGVSYLLGEVNYANWPMIVSKDGNKKIFIDTKWAHPYEQTWSSHVYNLIKDGKINAGLLLASPIWHERIKHYKPEERREN